MLLHLLLPWVFFYYDLLLHPSRLLVIMNNKNGQVKGVLKKTVKEKSTPAAVGSHGLKPSRPKATNPKPFRLRTDVYDPSHLPSRLLVYLISSNC